MRLGKHVEPRPQESAQDRNRESILVRRLRRVHLPLEHLVTHEFPLERVREAFALFRSGEDVCKCY